MSTTIACGAWPPRELRRGSGNGHRLRAAVNRSHAWSLGAARRRIGDPRPESGRSCTCPSTISSGATTKSSPDSSTCGCRSTPIVMAKASSSSTCPSRSRDIRRRCALAGSTRSLAVVF